MIRKMTGRTKAKSENQNSKEKGDEKMIKLETLGAVHTHTHTSSFKNC